MTHFLDSFEAEQKSNEEKETPKELEYIEVLLFILEKRTAYEN